MKNCGISYNEILFHLKKKILKHVTMLISLKDVMLSEISQSQHIPIFISIIINMFVS
jgi:hypothetical protein